MKAKISQLFQYILTACLAGTTLTFLTFGVGAQDSLAFPPPLTRQIVMDQCRAPFGALAADINAKGQLVREAKHQGATAKDICKLMMSYEEAEVEMFRFIEANSKICGVLRDFREKIRINHAATERMKAKACSVRWQFGYRRG